MLMSLWKKFVKKTEEPSDTTDDTINKTDSSVPASTNKHSRSMVGTIVGLIAIVVAANVLIHVLHHNSVSPSLSTDDTYSLSGTPLTTTNASVSVTRSPQEQRLQAQEAKLKAMQLAQAAVRYQQQRQSSQVLYSMNMHSSSHNPDNASSDKNVNNVFMDQAQHQSLVRVSATHDVDLAYTVSQGTFIDATLAVAIDSDLPGQIEAIVSHNVYGDVGEQILIPKGSRLIGRYVPGSSFQQHQSRLFIVWDRVLEPNGIVVPLASPGTDSLGRAGVTGSVDYHFFARFGSAILTSVLSAGSATVGVSSGDSYNSADAYRQSVSQALANQSGQLLQRSQSIPPTIHIPQGTRIQVFVNKNIDFRRVLRQLGASV